MVGAYTTTLSQLPAAPATWPSLTDAHMRIKANPRRTRIVCTIGPASDDAATIRAMLRAGMDVARLNFSHGAHAEHAARIALLREVSAELDHPLALLQDLQGPKIRIERSSTPDFADRGLQLVRGALVDLTGRGSGAFAVDDVPLLTVSYPAFHEDLLPDMDVLLDDGMLKMRAIGTMRAFAAEIVDGGEDSQGRDLPEPLVRHDVEDAAIWRSASIKALTSSRYLSSSAPPMSRRSRTEFATRGTTLR